MREANSASTGSDSDSHNRLIDQLNMPLRAMAKRGLPVEQFDLVSDELDS